MIFWPIVKVIEEVVLRELKKILELRMAKNQVGFLSGQSTQVHILRLLGKIQDVKTGPYFRCGSWLCLFVDFRSAFDKVDHEILFQKLRSSGVSERSMNILKLLYNS